LEAVNPAVVHQLAEVIPVLVAALRLVEALAIDQKMQS
jgi:hypothetical protein